MGNDTITGGDGTNVILGDSGAIYAAASDANRFGALPITIGMVETTAPGIGGNDTIAVGTGSAIVMGGTGADSIFTSSSTSFVFGDDGYISWVGTELNPDGLSWPGANTDPTNIDVVASTTPGDGGDDTITIGSGKSIVVGGMGNDRITGGSDTNVILGDSGMILSASADTNRFGDLPMTIGLVETTAPGIGGNDVITTLDGNDIVLGGTGADSITTGAGTSFVFGDDGYISWVATELNPDNVSFAGADANPADIDLVASTTPTDGGNDTIVVGSGDTIVVGGQGNDSIHGRLRHERDPGRQRHDRRGLLRCRSLRLAADHRRARADHSSGYRWKRQHHGGDARRSSWAAGRRHDLDGSGDELASATTATSRGSAPSSTRKTSGPA